MSYISIQLRSGPPDKDPLELKELILGKSSSGWSTSNLRSTPVQPTISGPSKKKEESDSSFTSVPLKDQIKEREDIHYPSVMGNVTSEVRQDITFPIPVKPKQDPIEAYLDRFLSLSEMKKLSTSEIMWVSQFIEGESREQQLYLLRELEKMEGSLPSI